MNEHPCNVGMHAFQFGVCRECGKKNPDYTPHVVKVLLQIEIPEGLRTGDDRFAPAVGEQKICQTVAVAMQQMKVVHRWFADCRMSQICEELP